MGKDTSIKSSKRRHSCLQRTDIDPENNIGTSSILTHLDQHRYRLHPDSPGPQQPAHWTSVSLLRPLEGSLNCSLEDPSSIPWLPLPNPHDSPSFWVKFWLSKSHKHNLSPWPLCLIPFHCPPFHSLGSNSHGPDCYSNTPGTLTKASTQTSPFHSFSDLYRKSTTSFLPTTLYLQKTHNLP